MPTTHANPTPFLPLPRDDFQWKCISKQEQHNNYGWFTTWLWGRSLTPLPPRVAFVWCGEEWWELRRQCARAMFRVEGIPCANFFCIFKRSLSFGKVLIKTLHRTILYCWHLPLVFIIISWKQVLLALLLFLVIGNNMALGGAEMWYLALVD